MTKSARLLVADADHSVRGIIRIATQEMGFVCDEAADGIAALKLFRHNQYSLAVLDAELPELDGALVCRQLRKSASIPVIFLSAHSGEAERLAAFAAGGNDYVLKPFYPRELVARITSLISLHGTSSESRNVLTAGKLTVDTLSRRVEVDGNEIVLTPKEYDLLLFFCQNAFKVYSRDALLNHVWGEEFFGSDRTVDTHVKSLRGKLGARHSYIVTVWGVGYKFET